MSSRWVPLMQGSMPEVITLQTSCEASGIPTFVPDMNIMQVDPFIRGGNAFMLQLCVPEDRLEEARTLVPPPRSAGTPAAEDAPSEIDILAGRVRWCCVLLITAPVGVWLGLRYLSATRGLDAKPGQHAWTLAAFWASVLATLLAATVYVFRIRHGH